MSQGTTYSTNIRMSRGEWKWFKTNINIHPLVFKGTHTYSFLRRGLTYESVRTQTYRECIRIDSTYKLKESKKAIGATFAYGVRKRAPKAPRIALCPIGKVPSKRSVAARKRHSKKKKKVQTVNSFIHLEPNSYVNAVIIDNNARVVNMKVRTSSPGIDFIYDPSNMDMRLILRYTNIIARCGEPKMSVVLGDDFQSLRSDWATSGAIGGGTCPEKGQQFEAGLNKSGTFCKNTCFLVWILLC